MKKLILSSLLLSFITLTSCNSDVDDTPQDITAQSLNLVTYIPDGATSVSPGTYLFNVKVGSQKGTITGAGISADNTTLSFTSSDVSYVSSGYDLIFKNISATATGSMSYPLTEGNFIVTPFYNYPAYYGISSPYNPPSAEVFPMEVIASYKLGPDYAVKTFQTNTFFRGETKTDFQYSGQFMSYSSEDMLYGLILQTGNNQATLIIYNAKFTNVPSEPTLAQMNISGLKTDFTGGMVTASGTDITPTILDNSVTVSQDDYKIKSIEFKTTSADLTKASISITMENGNQISFSGSYLYAKYN